MRTIFKYPLKINGEQQVELPKGAEILHVGVDPRRQLRLWAIIDDQEKTIRSVAIYVIGTGNLMPEDQVTHLGTAVMDPFVWHVFISNVDNRIL